jgi:hypothetical protein
MNRGCYTKVSEKEGSGHPFVIGQNKNVPEKGISILVLHV